MGGGKSSGSTSATLTPEQKELLGLQVGALKDTFLPAYQNTVTGANTMLQQTMPYTNQAAQNAYQNAASISNAQNSIGGELVGAGRNLATAGTTGVLNTANQLSNAANQLGYAGGGGAKSVADQMATASSQLGAAGGSGAKTVADQMAAGANQLSYAGGGGTKNIADLMATSGQNLASYGTQGLMNLFSPDYKNEQIQASLQPAREAIREQQAGQNAMYGAAGGLGSSRMALADRNLGQLGQQRLQSAAAQTSAAVEGQRQQAANTLLGTGAQGLSTAGGLYGNLLSGGLNAGSTAANTYGNLLTGGLGAGSTAANTYGNLLSGGLTAGSNAGNMYGNLLTSGLGSAGAGANLMGQSVDTSGKAIGYSQAPMDLYSKYASIVYGTPQASTTANFSGTQGQNTSSSGKGFKL